MGVPDWRSGSGVTGEDGINASYRDLHLWVRIRPAWGSPTSLFSSTAACSIFAGCPILSAAITAKGLQTTLTAELRKSSLHSQRRERRTWPVPPCTP